jgi:hypothetical protein
LKFQKQRVGSNPQTYNKTQQVIEHRNRLRHDPGNDPDTNANGDPGSDGEQTAVVHLVGTAEDADVDVFACNVAKDDARKNSLRS